MPQTLHEQPRVEGLIFDLDGTLIDSGLDFDQMRREMGLSAGSPVLETVATLPAAEQIRCRRILDEHEQAGVLRAKLLPGVADFFARLDQLQIPRAVQTRNCRAAALDMLKRCGLSCERLLAREDAPAKPDPTGILSICGDWQLAPEQVAMVGDFHFDLDAGRAAGAWTVLYLRGRSAEQLPWAARADLLLDCFTQPEPLLAWLTGYRD